MKKLAFIFTSMFVVLGACSNDDQAIDEAVEENGEILEEDLQEIATNVEEKMNELENTVDQAIIDEGETAELNTNAFVAFKEDVYEELYDLHEMDYDNVDDFNAMIEANDIKLLEIGTEVQVVDTELTEAEVILPETNKTGYIHTSLLTQTSS